MRGVNRVTVAGYLGADPEIRTTRGGTRVAQLRIATHESHKDRETGERRQVTDWHRAVAFGRHAEFVEKWLSRGDPVFLEGRLKTRKWKKKEGSPEIDRWTTEIWVDEVQLLGRRETGESEASAEEPPPDMVPEEFDDDIPFG